MGITTSIVQSEDKPICTPQKRKVLHENDRPTKRSRFFLAPTSDKTHEPPRLNIISLLGEEVVIKCLGQLLCDDPMSLRAVTNLTRRFYHEFGDTYLRATGFNLYHDAVGKRTLDLNKTSSYSALLIWRLSPTFATHLGALRRLTIHISSDLTAATYEARMLHRFLLSLPTVCQDPFAIKVELHVGGCERVELSRVFRQLHRLGNHKLLIIFSPPHLALPAPRHLPIFDAEDNPNLLECDVRGALRPYQSSHWLSSICNTSTLDTLRFSGVDLTSANWSTLLSSIHLPVLKELKVDIRVCWKVLIGFLRRHQTLRILSIRQLRRSRAVMLLSDDNQDQDQGLDLPILESIEGQASFVVKFLHHLNPSSPLLLEVGIWPDGLALTANTLGVVLNELPETVRSLSVVFPGGSLGNAYAESVCQKSAYKVVELRISRDRYDDATKTRFESNIAAWLSGFPSVASILATERSPPTFKAAIIAASSLHPDDVLVNTLP
ncbi:hypothetical protein BD410DRAFT_838560 [Rickenella mellea]|uniref:F-box domain-containing protein n=1 Tax=Rickenella mellea TaxID=50990 RepID=A0A4Y7Q9Z8_9AGAM|nr:hypothetical protein BD410DRAFT_838560 [Rickenella mellea]